MRRVLVDHAKSRSRMKRNVDARDFVEQPGAREPNIAMHGRGRHVDRRGDLVIRQAAEIVQFDDLGQARF